MNRDVAVRTCWLAGLFLLVGPLAVRAFVLLATPAAHLRDLVDFVYDDGYYYLTIAANFADSGRSTFDGISATNGYQPLWLIVLAGLGKLVGTRPYTFFLGSCALIYAIAGITPLLAMLRSKGDQRTYSLCFAAGLAIVIAQQPVVFIQGLEPILFAPLSILLVALLERAEVDSRTLLQLSAVLAVAFLIRLDSLVLFIAIIGCMPLFEMLSGRLGPRDILPRIVRVGARLSVFVVPTVLAYLALNQWLFGSPVPVSGLAKLIGGTQFSNWGASAIFFRSWKTFGVLIAILLALEITAKRVDLRLEAVFYRALSVLSVAIPLQAFYYATFSAWYVWPWYTYLVAIYMALIIGRIIFLSSMLYAAKGLRPVTLLARSAATLALLIVGAWGCYQSFELGWGSLSPKIQASLRHRSDGVEPNNGAETPSFNAISLMMLDEFFPTGRHTVIAMGDRAGGLAYWGRDRLSIVQTEGLTLDIAYIKARAVDAGAQYLERFPITYFVTDREVLPTVVGTDGQVQYVVPEPIQGRINTAPVPTFCFRPSAIRYQRTYPSQYGVNKRLAFQFSDRVPCSIEAVSLVRSIETGIGLRQYSLPGEYQAAYGGSADKRSEDRDRRMGGALSNP